MFAYPIDILRLHLPIAHERPPPPLCILAAHPKFHIDVLADMRENNLDELGWQGPLSMGDFTTGDREQEGQRR
jgi:hypothetical protein